MIIQGDVAGRDVGENEMVTIVPTANRPRNLAARITRPTGPLPRPARRSQVFDAALALGIGVAGVIATGNGGDHNYAIVQGVPQILAPSFTGGRSGVAALVAVSYLALALRRRFPLAVLWAVMGTTVLMTHDAPKSSFYACVIAAYSAAAYSPYRIPTLTTLPVAALLVSLFRDSTSTSVPDRYVPFLVLVPIVVAANAIRTWKRRAEEDRAQVSALEREQIEALRRAVEFERARIARELHDVVTHNVSVMVIQAGAARRIMDADPGQAKEALLAVEAGGRAAMSELRHVMGLLTMEAGGSAAGGNDGADPAGAADLVPQPGLDGLEALVARVRDTGVPVQLTVAGEPRPVPSGVELTAYRVVQEALTNTVKHAAGANAAVEVEYSAHQLRVEITDTGGRPGASAASGNGRGLIGLRERLAVYDGTLLAARRPGGGYRVKALIPLEVL